MAKCKIVEIIVNIEHKASDTVFELLFNAELVVGPKELILFTGIAIMGHREGDFIKALRTEAIRRVASALVYGRLFI